MRMLEDVELMPTEHQEAARRMEAGDGAPGRARAVADYIAGMTDRYRDPRARPAVRSVGADLTGRQ